MSKLINIEITGPTHSGKGYVIAAIAKALEELGCEVVVQAADTHNQPKLAKTPEEIASRLNGQVVRITEMQTFSPDK